MSYVFKQIDPAYKTATPFYAHKLWSLSPISNVTITTDPGDPLIEMTYGGEISMSIYHGIYNDTPWIGPQYEQRTAHGEFNRNVWNSVHYLYIDDFQNKPYENYKQGHIGVETRNTSQNVVVFSIPQKIIGLGIKPKSFKLTTNDYTYVDDGNGNIIGYQTGDGPASTIYNTGSKDLYYCSFFFNEGIKEIPYTTTTSPKTYFTCKSHGNLGATVPWNLDNTDGIAAPVHGPNYVLASINNVASSVNTPWAPGNRYYLNFQYDTFNTASSYVRVPHTKKLNFGPKEELSISMWVNVGTNNGTVTLLTKNGRRRVLKKRLTGQIINGSPEYNDYIDDEVYLGAYPFAVELNGSTINFSISDGAVTSTATANVGGGWQLITCVKNSASMQVYVGTSTGTAVPCGCLGETGNDADIFMGVRGDLISSSISMAGSTPAAGTTQYNGLLGPVHIFNKALTATDVTAMFNDDYNNHYGNILYKQGQIIWTNTHGTKGSRDFEAGSKISFTSMKFRSTKLITTNEYICAVAPGELNMTTNPSVLLRSTGYCNAGINNEGISYPNEDGECYSFVTASSFSPYVTGIGLYNDAGDLLVMGKLSTPIKKATNCDTIFVVKWDES